MPYRNSAFLGDLGVEISSRSFMRSSYDLSTVVPFSRRITYGGDVCSSDVIDSCSKVSLPETPQFSILKIMGWKYS